MCGVSGRVKHSQDAHTQRLVVSIRMYVRGYAPGARARQRPRAQCTSPAASHPAARWSRRARVARATPSGRVSSARTASLETSPARRSGDQRRQAVGGGDLAPQHGARRKRCCPCSPRCAQGTSCRGRRGRRVLQPRRTSPRHSPALVVQARSAYDPDVGQAGDQRAVLGRPAPPRCGGSWSKHRGENQAPLQLGVLPRCARSRPVPGVAYSLATLGRGQLLERRSVAASQLVPGDGRVGGIVPGREDRKTAAPLNFPKIRIRCPP